MIFFLIFLIFLIVFFYKVNFYQMKSDELHEIISDLLDKKLERHRPRFNTHCPYFTRIRPTQRPFCQKANNRKTTGFTKKGLSYESMIANCENCDLEEESND